MSLKLLFRVDADSLQGSGHLMRCLGLAQALHDRGGSSVLLTKAEDSERLEPWTEEAAKRDRARIEILEPGVATGSVRDAAATKRTVERYDADWTIVDGYAFGRGFQVELADGGGRRLYLDDHGERYDGAQVILRHNARRSEPVAFQDGGVDILEGAEYFLARRSVRETIARHENDLDVKAILLSFGAADVDNLGLRAAKELAGVLPEGMRLILAVTGGEECLDAAQAFGATRPYVTVLKMPDIIALSDEIRLAVTAGGVTSLELAALGIPLVVMLSADNQTDNVSSLVDAGCALSACDWSDMAEKTCALAVDLSQLNEMCKRGQALLDAQGANRVLDFLTGGAVVSRPFG